MNWTYIHVFTRANGSNSATTGCLSSFNFLLFLGWTGVIAYKDKEQIVATAILHEVIWKRESSINQLLHGLKFFNVLDVVRKFPQHFIYTNTVLNSTVLLQHTLSLMRHQIILKNEQRNSLLNILMKMLKYHVATVSFCVHLHTSCAIAQSVVGFEQKKNYESKNFKRIYESYEFICFITRSLNLFVSIPIV